MKRGCFLTMQIFQIKSTAGGAENQPDMPGTQMLKVQVAGWEAKDKAEVAPTIGSRVIRVYPDHEVDWEERVLAGVNNMIEKYKFYLRERSDRDKG